MMDALLEAERIAKLRPGTADCDANGFAVEYPVPLGVLLDLIKEIKTLRADLQKAIEIGLRSQDKALQTFRDLKKGLEHGI